MGLLIYPHHRENTYTHITPKSKHHIIAAHINVAVFAFRNTCLAILIADDAYIFVCIWLYSTFALYRNTHT